MNRWNTGVQQRAQAWIAWMGIAAAWFGPLPAQGQSGTDTVANPVQYAHLRVLQSPEIVLNDQPARLSPGARIRTPTNLIALPASLSGQNLPVLFRREPNGLVHDAWILTDAEAASLGRATTPSALNQAIALLLATRR